MKLQKFSWCIGNYKNLSKKKLGLICLCFKAFKKYFLDKKNVKVYVCKTRCSVCLGFKEGQKTLQQSNQCVLNINYILKNET